MPAPNSSAFSKLWSGWERGCCHCFEPGWSLLLRPQSCSSTGALLPPLLLAVTAEQLFGWESTCLHTGVAQLCPSCIYGFQGSGLAVSASTGRFRKLCPLPEPRAVCRGGRGYFKTSQALAPCRLIHAAPASCVLEY